MVTIKNLLTATLMTSALFLGACSTPLSTATVTKVATTSAPVAAVVTSSVPATSVLASDANAALKAVATGCTKIIAAQAVAQPLVNLSTTVAADFNLGDSVCHSVEAMQSVAGNPTTANWEAGIADVLTSAGQIAVAVSK